MQWDDLYTRSNLVLVLCLVALITLVQISGIIGSIGSLVALLASLDEVEIKISAALVALANFSVF